jgi:hypothetical protein
MKCRTWRSLPAQKKPLNKQRHSMLNERTGRLLPVVRDTLIRAALILVLAMGRLLATQGGFLEGAVRDRSGTAVEGAEVQIQSEMTGARQKVSSDEQGRYISAELTPGTYKLTVRAHGFRTVTESGLVVQAGQTRIADFVIEILPLQQEITVQSTRDESDPAGSGLAVSRQSAASTLPANGRDLHAFYGMVPGSTVTPASTGDGGQFTVDGQRPNANTVRVDGINGNAGLGVSVIPGTYPGSSLPGMTVIGSTQDLVSKEEIERVELRSADFAPEYGDRPGAQIRIETRSGSNDFHGGAFGYLRPAWLDSPDWFAEKYSFPLKAASLNGYGGSFGGPIFRNRTFFFVALEDENLNDTALQLMPVPSMQARAAVEGPYALLLNAFPLPIGPSLNTNESLGAVALKKQASVENYSARADQILGEKGRLFARYAYVPSHSVTKQLGTANAGFDWLSATAGATMDWKETINDFRFNFSRVTDASWWVPSLSHELPALNAFSNPLPSQLPGIQAGFGVADLDFVNPYSATALSIAGIGQLVSTTVEHTYQHQLEGNYTFSMQRGAHDFRMGADYVQLVPRTTVGSGLWTTSIASAGVEALLAGAPLGVTVSLGKPTISSGRIPIGSLFAQDTFHVNDRLTLLYGLRWEVTPPKTTQSWSALWVVGAWGGPNTAFQPAGSFSDSELDESNWNWHYTQFAPRLGLAYHFRPLDVIFRAGAGLFYDDALGSLLYAVNLSPLNMWQYLPGNSVNSSQAESFTEPTPPLSLPRVWEWRTSLEKSFEGRSTLSLAYTGSAGRKLLRLDGTVDPTTEVLEGTYFTNYGASDYEALAAQFTGNLSSNLYTLISYTWGHSIDTGSLGSAVFVASPGSSVADDRGSSNFDVRHNLNTSLGYRLPSWHANGLRGVWFSGWNLSSTLQARTGFPFDVTTTDRSIGLGFANTGRADLVPGAPVWIDDSAVPGGRELNPAAFAATPELTNGTLGRNVLTGPGLFQIDASLRRQFRLFGATSLEMSITAFNILNHANFSNPVGYLGSALFGQPVSMQNLMLGSGTPTNGLTPIFQSGGPRTAELNFKFSF